MADNNTKGKVGAAAKIGVDISSGNYVGAAVSFVDAFGDDIKKIAQFVIVIFIVLFIGFIMLISMFSNLPGLLINNFLDTMEQEIDKWSVSIACKVINNSLEGVQENISDDIIKEIESGYIKNYKSKCDKFWENGFNKNMRNGTFNLSKESGTSNYIAWEYHCDKKEKAGFYTMFRLQSGAGKEVNVDTLYFINAYSVWHQNHDLGSDDEYKESDDLSKRWTLFDTIGLKKFINKHKKEFISADYEYTTEYVVNTVKVTENGKEKKKRIKIPVKVINVKLKLADNDTLNNTFQLTEEEAEVAQGYTIIAKGLFNTVKRDSVNKLVVKFEPMPQILQNLFSIDSSLVSDASTVDIESDVRKRGYIIIRQNDPKYSGIKYGHSTIGYGGCGACSSLMVVRNLTTYTTSLKTFKTELEQIGARNSSGTAIYKVAPHLKKNYGLSYTHTSDVNVLKQHLKQGEMAVVNVGARKLFTNGSGHFVAAVGVYKDSKGKEYAVILDPSYSYSKYNNSYRKGYGIKDVDGILLAPFSAIKADAKTEYYYCFKAKPEVKKEQTGEFNNTNDKNTTKKKES